MSQNNLTVVERHSPVEDVGTPMVQNANPPNPVRLSEAALFVLTLVNAAGIPYRLMGGDSLEHAGSAGDTTTSQAFNLFQLLFTAYVVYPKIPTIWRFLRQQVVFLSFSIYCFVSLAWSPIAFNDGFRFFRYQSVLLISSVYVAVRLSPREYLRLMAETATWAAIISIPMEDILGHGSQIAPGWMGVFPQKNSLGDFMLFGILALVWEERKWNFIRIAKAAVMVTLLVLSQSATASVLLAIMLIVTGVGKLRGFTRGLASVILVIFGTCASLFLSDPIGSLLAVGDKTTTLTGRTEIWAFTWRGILEHPIIGYGLLGFWEEMGSTAKTILTWNPHHAHNGFLQTAADEGAIGLLLLVAIIVNSIFLGLRSSETAEGRLCLYFSAIFIIHNVTESDVFQISPFWFMFMVTFFNAAWQEQSRRQDNVAVRLQLLPMEYAS